MTKSFYFYGYVDSEEDNDPIWKVLHDHFEKLAREMDDAEETFREGKAVEKK